MLTGVNHINIAVTDIEESFEFYVTQLGFMPHAKWDNGAYISLGGTWFCLSADEVSPAQDYSHLALNVTPAEFSSQKAKLLALGVNEWKQNSSEGESMYFLDPNGHKLELHVGGLQDRLASLNETS